MINQKSLTKTNKYSNLDFTVTINPDDIASVMQNRFEIIAAITGNIAAFTGEHVGELRLIIALFEPHTIHVDLKFADLTHAGQRVDDTKVLWENASQLTDVLNKTAYQYPQPDPQWIEDRFWIWSHYAATKIARGEYFETLEFISFIRQNVLSPLALKQSDLTPSGVRKIESRLPDFAAELQKTVVMPEKDALIIAVEQCIKLYLSLRENEVIEVNDKAQEVCLNYFKTELKQSSN